VAITSSVGEDLLKAATRSAGSALGQRQTMQWASVVAEVPVTTATLSRSD
jgi:hypothetical protein